MGRVFSHRFDAPAAVSCVVESSYPNPVQHGLAHRNSAPGSLGMDRRKLDHGSAGGHEAKRNRPPVLLESGSDGGPGSHQTRFWPHLSLERGNAQFTAVATADSCESQPSDRRAIWVSLPASDIAVGNRSDQPPGCPDGRRACHTRCAGRPLHQRNSHSSDTGATTPTMVSTTTRGPFGGVGGPRRGPTVPRSGRGCGLLGTVARIRKSGPERGRSFFRDQK